MTEIRKNLFTYLFIYLLISSFIYSFRLTTRNSLEYIEKKMLNNTNTVNTFRLKLTFEQKKLKNLQKSLTLINIRLKQLNWP